MIVIAIIGVLAAIAVPNFQKARRKANSRACYANMKTIAGAFEMYNLDFNTDITDYANAEIYGNLASGGYLQTVPQHPGTGDAPSAVYDADANRVIFCGEEGEGVLDENKHGSIQATASGT